MSQSQEDEHYEVSTEVKFMEGESVVLVVRRWRGRDGQLWLNGYNVSVSQQEKYSG
jgi:hypothetical protein